MAGRLFGSATQFLPFPSPVRRQSSLTLEDTLMPKDTTLGWKFARPKISRLHLTLAELDFEYPTINSLRAPNNTAIVLKNSNHNNRQSLMGHSGFLPPQNWLLNSNWIWCRTSLKTTFKWKNIINYSLIYLYQPSHPFRNTNIMVKERWRMQCS